jgi:hypothetical protein
MHRYDFGGHSFGTKGVWSQIDSWSGLILESGYAYSETETASDCTCIYMPRREFESVAAMTFSVEQGAKRLPEDRATIT